MGTGLASVRQDAFLNDAPESRVAHFLKMWAIATPSSRTEIFIGFNTSRLPRFFYRLCRLFRDGARRP